MESLLEELAGVDRYYHDAIIRRFSTEEIKRTRESLMDIVSKLDGIVEERAKEKVE